MFECPWPLNRLKRLSRHIRDGSDPPPDLPTYRDVMIWYNRVATDVQRDIDGLDWRPLLGDRAWEVTSRAKTIDTLRDKLADDLERDGELTTAQALRGELDGAWQDYTIHEAELKQQLDRIHQQFRTWREKG